MSSSWVARRGRAVAVSGLVASGFLFLGVAGAQASNAACPAASSSTATSCTFTSGTPLFTVPAGVGSVDVVAVGAAGGGGVGSFHNSGNGNEDGSGGPGASVEDTAVPVVPSETLGVYVGAVGADGGGSNSGGIPGGGPGGRDVNPPTGDTWGGGGGGGFSGVEAPDSSALVIAGGGGGGGEAFTLAHAGSGGAGDTGSGGGTGGVGPYGGSGGGGGSATSGGAAGSNGCSDANPSSATAGSSEQGGTGIDSRYVNLTSGAGAGGGGGGGYYGGGGGGAGCDGSGSQFGPDGQGNGGGGGSSYGITGLTNEQVASGPASVTISWSLPSYLKSFGGSGGGAGQFSGPQGIAIDPSNGVMYVADQAHSRIEVFDSSDKFLFSFSTASAPYGIAGDFSSSPGMLYVTEPGAPGGVQIIDGSGYSYGFVTQVPGSGTPLLTGVAVDPSTQTVYVADSGNNQIDKYDESGALIGSFDGSDSGTAFNDPTGVAVDPGRSRVYVADGQNQRVAVFDLSGTYVSAFGTGGSGTGQFGLPNGVAVQPRTGNVFVVDGNNNRVESFAPDGTYINSFGAAGSGNDQFSAPWGVAFAPDGSFFVTDTGNNRVEKFGQPGPLSQFVIAAPAVPTSGSPQTIRVTAMDAAGDVISNYSGSPTWSDTGGQLTGSPAAFSGGVSTNSVTFTKAVHAERITVTDGSVSTQSAAFNVLGSLTHFYTPVPTSASVGVAVHLKVYAEDSAGNVLTNYHGSPTWTSSGGQLSAAPAAFSSGVSTNTITFTKAVHAERITVKDGSVSSTTSAFNVIGPLAKFATPVPGSTSVGVAVPLKVYAEDSAGNVLTGYSGSPTWSDTGGQITGSPAAFSGGVSNNSVTFSKAVHAERITVTNGTVSSTTGAFNVIGPLAQFYTPVPASATVGVAFTLKVYAEDSAGNVLTAYHGSPTWSSSGGQLSASPAAFSSGVSTNTIKFTKAVHAERVTVKDGTVTSTTSTFNVIGPLARFVILVPSSATHGTPFSVKIQAEDTAGDLVSGYHSPTTWSDSSGQITGSPAAFSGGVSSNQVTVANPHASDRITVTNGTITNQSATFNIN